MRRIRSGDLNQGLFHVNYPGAGAHPPEAKSSTTVAPSSRYGAARLPPRAPSSLLAGCRPTRSGALGAVRCSAARGLSAVRAHVSGRLEDVQKVLAKISLDIAGNRAVSRFCAAMTGGERLVGHYGFMPEPVLINIRVLKPSRRRLTPGDVFAVGLPGETYIFGRVIRADLPRERAPMPKSNLIYIYRHRSQSKVPELDQLTPDHLLIPPAFTNRLAWSRGYFETVASQPLTPADLLPVHCFRHYKGTFVDEDGNPLPAERQPCGSFALCSYRWLDDRISEALGIPLVPQDT